MAITLNDIKLNTTDKLVASVVDEFRRSNFLLANMPFDDTLLPLGNGSSPTYSYYRIVTQPTAAFRSMNGEYTTSNAVKEKISVELKAFGGSYTIDRVLAAAGGFVDEVDVQTRQMIRAAQTLFNATVINGNTTSNAAAFDGLSKALTGKSTEYNAQSGSANVDLSASNIDSNYKTFLDKLDEFILSLDQRPTALLANAGLIAKIRACVRRCGIEYKAAALEGGDIPTYDGIPLVDAGQMAGEDGATDVIVTTSGVTELYAVRLGLDGLHGVCMHGESPIKVWVPDFTTAGAVKKGEVEMVAAIALKNTAAAGVFRKIKIA